MQQKKIGVVGSGRMALEHIRALASHEQIEIASICSIDGESANTIANEFGIQTICLNMEDMQLGDLDAVIAAVSIESLDIVYEQLLRTNIPVLLEKPFGMTLSSARHLAEISATRFAETFVALNRRNYGNIRTAYSQVNQYPGRRIIEVRDQQWTSDPVGMGLSDKGQRFWPLANTIHTFDLGMSFARGDIVDIKRSGSFDSNNTSLFSISAEIYFESGDELHFYSLWNSPGPWSVAINTDSARWTLQPLETAVYQNRVSSEIIPSDPFDVDFKAGLYYQCGELVQHLSGLPHSLVPVSTAMRSIEALSSIFDLDDPELAVQNG